VYKSREGSGWEEAAVAQICSDNFANFFPDFSEFFTLEICHSLDF